MTCEDCNGSGQYVGLHQVERCQTCDGAGEAVPHTRSVNPEDIKITFNGIYLEGFDPDCINPED